MYLSIVEIVDDTKIKVIKEDGDDIAITTGGNLLFTPITPEGARTTGARQIRKKRTNYNFYQKINTEVDIQTYTTDDPARYVLSEAVKRWEDAVDNALLSKKRYEDSGTRYM